MYQPFYNIMPTAALQACQNSLTFCSKSYNKHAMPMQYFQKSLHATLPVGHGEEWHAFGFNHPIDEVVHLSTA
ncbi:unnamed protein product [Ixodes pacificus]